jgi:hypothetical protein
MGEMITMITGIARRSAGMRVNLKQCDGNLPKTKEKAGKSLIQKISKTSQNIHKKMI